MDAKESVRLLTSKELEACKQIVATDENYAPRANTLILIDEGLTQSQAAEQTGLTIGQVRYWLTRFRKLRLTCFPQSDSNDVTGVEGKEKKEKQEKTKKKAKTKEKSQKGKKKDKESKKSEVKEEKKDKNKKKKKTKKEKKIKKKK